MGADLERGEMTPHPALRATFPSRGSQYGRQVAAPTGEPSGAAAPPPFCEREAGRRAADCRPYEIDDSGREPDVIARRRGQQPEI